MKKTEVKVLRNNKQQIEDKLMLKKEKIYVLKNKSLRLEIIWLHHNTLIVEYEGQWNWLLKIIGGQKLQKIKTKYSIRKTVTTYISRLYYKVTSIQEL